MKAIIADLYWQACQYPWYIITNIGFAVVFYLLSMQFGRSMRLLLVERTFGLSIATEPALVSFLLDLTVAFVILSILFVLISLPVLFHKGIVFTVIGYTLYYWFLFYPVHLVFVMLVGKPWAVTMKLPIILLAGILIAIFTLSIFYFPNHIQTKHLTFTTPKITHAVRIIHLSDIHADHYGSREAKVVSLANKHTPDLIVVTGDMFVTPYEYNKKGFNAAVRILKQLNAKKGVYMVEGHHDEGKAHHLLEALDGDVRLLYDSYEHINCDSTTLSLFGSSLESKVTKFAQDIKDKDYSIYVAHSPKLRRNLRSSDFDLALFGHTHGCQVYIPIVSYFITGKYRHGLYEYNGVPIYVNAGIGMEGYLAPRIRWFTYPEVVVIDLIPENPASTN